MIEKKIHGVWLGRMKPSTVEERIANWKEVCPDYEIIIWSEDNFDINKNLFCKQAFEKKKWAFASDYIRLNVLYNHGGIYLDSDVEVLQPFDKFLHLSAFVGFEDDRLISTAVIGAEKGHTLIKKLLEYYENRSFILPNNKLNCQANPIIFSKIVKNNYPKFEHNNTLQHFDCFTIFPRDYFSPISVDTKKINKTKNTHTIHHFEGSWLKNKPINRKLIQVYKRIVGEKIATYIRSKLTGV